MSSDLAGSPSAKRFRPDKESYSHSVGPEDAGNQNQNGTYLSEDAFKTSQLRHFDLLDRDDDCVAGNSRRHLFSPPQYATAAAAVMHPNDTELLSNGDSGFQELNILDEVSLDMNENNTITSEDISKQGLIENLGSNNITDEQSNEDKEFDEDSVSEISCISDISNLSGQDWKPIGNHIKWVHRQMENGTDPKAIILQLTGKDLPDEIDDISAWRFIVRMLSEPLSRPKLNSINTIDDVINLIQKSSRIIVLTGAGVSVSCGIPDFRSHNGIYARLSKDFPDLPDPQSMFDVHYFKRNPYPFFKFAKEIYPGQFLPSPSHKFIKYMERKGKLLRNYSQNIDTLEQAAGIEKVITCHGSFATATCTNCGYKVDSNAIKNDIFAQHIPLCPKCSTDSSIDSSTMSVMKPDIVFFGEGLSDVFHDSMTVDKEECDLLIVIGSSLKVRPVALIPNSIPENIPQILINREPLNHLNFDVELLGDCDIIVKHLCERLGDDWTDSCFLESDHTGEKELSKTAQKDAFEFFAPCRYLFKGAELSDSCPDEDDDSDDYDSDDEDENESKLDVEKCSRTEKGEQLTVKNEESSLDEIDGSNCSENKIIKNYVCTENKNIVNDNTIHCFIEKSAKVDSCSLNSL